MIMSRVRMLVERYDVIFLYCLVVNCDCKISCLYVDSPLFVCV